MKNKAKILMVLVVLGIVLISVISLYNNTRRESFLNRVEGKIYYLKRDEEILKLYTSDANLKNEKLVYSHYKKGKIDDENYNDNVTDFRYYPESHVIEFEAMYNGQWTIFRMDEGDAEPRYIKNADEFKILEDYRVVSLDVDYVHLETDKLKIFDKDGSIFLETNGEVKCIKKYRGFVKSDIRGIVGYVPQGLSPDSRYLIYGSTGSFTGIGYFLGINKYKRYIMDLDTLESHEYVNVERVQWVDE